MWELDKVMRTADPVTVRHALKQLISGIVCDFEFDVARSTAKRKRYKFAGAEMVMRSLELTTLP